jgi:aminoglycoside phosphotransferase (APT) family kinase protein
MMADTATPVAAVACYRLMTELPESLERLSATRTSAAYRAYLLSGRSVIVKVHFTPGRADSERQALACVAAHTDVPTPEVLGCASIGRNAEALILDDLGPVNLAQATASGRFTRDQMLESVGTLLTRVHRLPLDCGPRSARGACPPMRPELLYQRAPAHLRDAAGPMLLAATDALGTGRNLVWCHGDLHPSNIVLGPHRGEPEALHAVDFEQFCCSIPEYDLAQSLVTSDAITGEPRERLLAGYPGELCFGTLAVLTAYHALRGWAYAAQIERRDATAWAHRLELAFHATCAPSQQGG